MKKEDLNNTEAIIEDSIKYMITKCIDTMIINLIIKEANNGSSINA